MKFRIFEYLDEGGKLIISGEDVGYYDGYSLPETWWYWYVEGEWTGELTLPITVTGDVDNLYAGLDLTLNGGDSADNQLYPDFFALRDDPSLRSEVVLGYDSGQPAGTISGKCKPGRAVYFGFGLEGVTDFADRKALLQGGMDYFAEPLQPAGVRYESDPVDNFILPNEPVAYELTIRNMSETITDTFDFTANGNGWSTSLLTPTLTLGPCEVGRTVLTITAPANLSYGQIHTSTLNVQSTSVPSATGHFDLVHHAPRRIALIDDDRWYDQEHKYMAALDAMGIEYDYWEIGWDNEVRGSPSEAFLLAHDIVIWHTGYDWFQPIRNSELVSLQNYMAQGGRLLLTSQDFLYYHADEPLATDYIGLTDYLEIVTPTLTFADPELPLLNQASPPLSLTYQSDNYSDGLIPGPDNIPLLWHDEGAAAVASQGDDWRMIFWSVPWGTLEPAGRLTTMNEMMGWLGDLGDSTFAVDTVIGSAGVRTYTITLRNQSSGNGSNQVVMTNTLPAGLDILTPTISGNASYNPTTRQLTWQGPMADGGVQEITYQAVVSGSLPAGSQLDNQLLIYYDYHDYAYQKTVSTWIGVPNLVHSELIINDDTPAPGNLITYWLVLDNSGAAGPVSATLYLPQPLGALTDTLSASSGTATLSTGQVYWEGNMQPAGVVTISLSLTTPIDFDPIWLPSLAHVNNGTIRGLIRHHFAYLTPIKAYYPLIVR